MTCNSCGSDKQRKFPAEIAIHFPGMGGLEKPIVWAFPRLLVASIVGTRNFPSPKANYAYLRKAAPLRVNDFSLRGSSATMSP